MLNKFQKQKLEKYFGKEPVVLVYLFGSQAEEKGTPLSDYDFAVLFEENLSRRERFQLRLKYITEVGKIFGSDRVEFLDLAEAPIQFRYSAFRPRKEIFIKDERERVKFEHQTMEEYFERLYYLKRHSLTSLKNIAREGL